jgi:hypothetical protein
MSASAAVISREAARMKPISKLPWKIIRKTADAIRTTVTMKRVGLTTRFGHASRTP